jgi:hypothetical protein
MTERYFLFRGDEVVYRCSENATGSLGAGESHAHGQDGDVLVCTRDNWIRAWHWIKPGTPMEMPWKDIPPEKLDANKYRLLLMLQI